MPDGTLYWGAIEQIDQVNWYRFNAISGTQYYIQTHNLLGHDGIEMATAVTLYESDVVTVIETSAHYRGTDVSNIDWMAPVDGAYLVSVAHAEQGRGTYALTVSESSLLSEFELAQASQNPGNSSGGGGSTDHILLIFLVILVLTIFYLRRRNQFS